MICEIWFAPREIVNFNRKQMIWLISWLPVLQGGEWPYNPMPHVGRSTSRKRCARFTTPCEFAAEVELRLERARTKNYHDDVMVKARYCLDEDDRVIAFLVGCAVEDVDHRINRALRYIKGRYRKRMPYTEWLAHRR